MQTEFTYTGKFDAAAQKNLETFRANPMPGDGIFLGHTASQSKDVQITFLTGQRNRVLDQIDPHSLHVIDPDSPDFKPIILYTAMEDLGKDHFVGNGLHTSHLMQDHIAGKPFERSLRNESYHNDELATPRIAAVTTREGSMVINKFMFIFRGRNGKPVLSLHSQPRTIPGYGEMSHTFAKYKDTDIFDTTPQYLPLKGETSEEIADYVWREVLNPQNALAVAVKTIDRRDGTTQMSTVDNLDPQVRTIEQES